jgi:hypothetical protein
MATRRTLRAAISTLVVALFVMGHARRGSADPPAADATVDARKSDAREHFELGLSHFDRAEWAAALAEFLKAREIFPTRSATKNAATCLRKENRFDEALEMFEALERDYPDLSETDRALADREISELVRSVGALSIQSSEARATIILDGGSRGITPLPAPLRVSVGTHVVRVYKEGFNAFEQRIEIASGQSLSLDAKLAALTRSGRLRVTEQSGRALEVVVDSAVVGQTPWEGAVAPGEHVVLLRGEGRMGTQPVRAPVTLDAETPLNLIAEELDASARVDPTPGGALVAIDGVTIGRGVWEGRLRSGPHVIEVSAEGFLPNRRQVGLRHLEREVVAISLERDPTSPLWGKRAKPRFSLELDGAFAFGPPLGGQVGSACSGTCSATLPLGGATQLTVAYELPWGFGAGVFGGYLAMRDKLSHRSAEITGPQLIASEKGTLNDTINLSGLLAGATLFYERGDSWPVTLRLGFGAFVATANDDRAGQFTTSAMANPPSTSYSVSASESHGATYLFAAPGLRFARRIGAHLELGANVDVFILRALTQPSWTDEKQILAAPIGKSGDGLGGFGVQTLTAGFLFVVAPGFSARYEF